MPQLEKILLAVYNDALSGVIPRSCQDIRVRLLLKKGGLSSLKNWRPILLINCDAKIFTRILSKRMGDIAGRLLNPYQSGFTLRRFIGDNGLALSMIMEQAAQVFDRPGIDLLLDQGKIHSGYKKRFAAFTVFQTPLLAITKDLF
jgi:hypothetical protein